MADRGHADADQVVGRQLRQHFAIDIIVAECRRVSFEPQPAQPRHYVHAVILGSEERQPLMNEDIILPVDLPGEALKFGWWQVSCLQRVNDRFQSAAIAGRANRECRLSTLLSRSRRVLRTAGMGQED
jgi:hypothetical protein